MHKVSLLLAIAVSLSAGCARPRAGSAGGDAGAELPAARAEAGTDDAGPAALPGRDGPDPVEASRASDSAPASPDATACPPGGCNFVPIAVVAREAASCAALSDGSVRCWGTNFHGELGNGSAASNVAEPVRVSGLADARMVTVGNGFACALGGSGAVRCWGRNFAGQLGPGATGDARQPVVVPGLPAATAIVAGDAQSCALLDTGVSCWGLVRGLTGAASPVPALQSGLEGARAVAAGRGHVCAVVASGRVRCLGDNATGQLGNGTTTESPTGVEVTGVTGATAITGGDSHTCAVVQGSVRCWGYNDLGQLGSGTTQNSSQPVSVNGVTGVSAVTAGLAHTCAVAAEGRVWCWGSNANGQLGNGTRAGSSSPVPVSGLSGATGVAAGARHSCALVGNNVRCWGDNFYGQLGDGTTTTAVTPADAVKL